MKTPERRTPSRWILPVLALLLAGACSDSGNSPVPDPEAKGGLRKFVVGQWWEETQYDTLVSTRDSGNVSTTTRRNIEHRRRSEVVAVDSAG